MHILIRKNSCLSMTALALAFCISGITQGTIDQSQAIGTEPETLEQVPEVTATPAQGLAQGDLMGPEWFRDNRKLILDIKNLAGEEVHAGPASKLDLTRLEERRNGEWVEKYSYVFQVTKPDGSLVVQEVFSRKARPGYGVFKADPSGGVQAECLKDRDLPGDTRPRMELWTNRPLSRQREIVRDINGFTLPTLFKSAFEECKPAIIAINGPYGAVWDNFILTISYVIKEDGFEKSAFYLKLTWPLIGIGGSDMSQIEKIEFKGRLMRRYNLEVIEPGMKEGVLAARKYYKNILYRLAQINDPDQVAKDLTWIINNALESIGSEFEGLPEITKERQS